MIRKQMVFSIFIFVGISIYAQVDENGNYSKTKNSKRNNLNNKGLIKPIPDIDIHFDSIRALSELNLPLNAEAYPWISDDGLRLYYTMETDSVDMIVLSKREHIDSSFKTPQILSINSSLSDNLSQWLTRDELNIYFFIKESDNYLKSTLYHSERKSREDEFGKPSKVVLQGNISGFLWGPSFTMDMKKLYLYNSNFDMSNTLIFEKVDIDEYQLIDTLNIPDGYVSDPGKLGQNDLKYYLALTDTNGCKALHVFERESVEDDFDSVYYLNNQIINDLFFKNIQPSISNNGNFFVFTRNGWDSWAGNDLYIAYNFIPSAGFVNNLLSNTKISVYPNPTVGYLTFEISESKNEELSISIYSINGRFQESVMISKNSFRAFLPAAEYKPGVYLYEITGSGSFLGSGKFIIKKH
jgi:hypothetical protein